MGSMILLCLSIRLSIEYVFPPPRALPPPGTFLIFIQKFTLQGLVLKKSAFEVLLDGSIPVLHMLEP